MEADEVGPAPMEKSTFVTVVAWVFIVLSGFATSISILQTIMVFLFFPSSTMAEVMNTRAMVEGMPPIARFVLLNLRAFLVGSLIISVTTLISSIGLLRRKNWARIVFICIIAIGIVWLLGTIPFQFAFMPRMMVDMPGQPPMPEFRRLLSIVQAFTTAFSLAISILFAWIIKRLPSEPFRRDSHER